MSNYTNLKNAIQSVIKANGNNEITGPILQAELLSMITTLGVGYQYMGVAQPSTNPGTPDARVMYFAYFPGTYVNFGGLTVTGFCVLKYDTVWTKENIPISGGGGGADFLTEPDDLTLEAVGNTNILKFANRSYNSQNPNGLGYKILRGDLTFAEQVTDANTIYEIRYDFDLSGTTVTIPSGCVLRFVGGSLSNGTLDGYQFKIESESKCFSGILFSDSYIAPIHSRWFVPVDKLSKKDTFIDCSTELQAWANCGSRNFYLDSGLYYVANTIVFDRKVCIDGDGNMLTPRQEWPENYWEQSALIFTNLEIPVINFVIGTESYKAFNLRNVGFANINKTPSANNIPIVKVDFSSGLWAIDFSAAIYGTVNGTVFNHTGYQFNASGNAFMALSTFGGVMDKLNRCFEFNKEEGSSAWNNLSYFEQIVTNCNEYIYAPDFLNYVTIKGQMQMNVNNATFFNEKAFCDVDGPVIWDAEAADYGGSGTTWTARYLVRANRKITYLNGQKYAFVRTDGSPIYYDAGSGNATANTIQSNSLLSLLKRNTGTSVYSFSMSQGGVDVSGKFEQGQVLEVAGSSAFETKLGANLAGTTDKVFELKIKSTGYALFKNVVLFLNSKTFVNKKIEIEYYKSNNTLIGKYSVSGTSDETQLPLPAAPNGTYYVIVTFHADTLASSIAPFIIPAVGIDSADTVNNFESDCYNAARVNRSAMLSLPTDSNDAIYEQFNINKRGKFGANDDAASFVYLCTQRFHYSVYASNSFRVLLNADGKTIRFEMSSAGQGNSPVVRINGDSGDVPFDVAVVKNTTSADNPFVELDVFVKRSLRYMPFVIIESFQNYRYSEIGEVYIKATAPTLADPANAYYKHSIGKKGATAERPSYPIVGDQFFDTTLLLPIWNKASGVWIDAAGNTV